MKRRKKKSPNEYPLFGCRVMPEIKEELDQLLVEVVEIKNRSIEVDEIKYKKNEVFVLALKRGLKQLKTESMGRKSSARKL